MKYRKPMSISVALIGTAMLLNACGGGGGNNAAANSVNFAAAAMISNLGNNIILAGYLGLDAAAADLQAKLDALADNGATEAR